MRRQKEKKRRAVVWFLLFVMTIGVDWYFIKSLTKDDSVVANTDTQLSEEILLSEANADNLTGKEMNQEAEANENVSAQKVLLDVPYINQTKEYLNACESISTVMALQYLGIDITVDDFINNYLDIGKVPYHDKKGTYWGSNPWEVFPGNPKDDTGWGCFAPVVGKALNKLLDPNLYEVKELYNNDVATLCSDYIDKGIPVIFWATIDMQTPYKGSTWKLIGTDEKFTWIRPMHCVLLVGYDDNYYYFNDPWKKKACKYKKAAVEKAYKGLYQQAVVITTK